MGKGLAGAFGAGVLIGVDRGIQRNKEQDRQAREDQMRQEEHDARMADVQRANDDRLALANAAKPVTVSDGATVTGVAANPTVYDSSDVASSDVRQANRLAAATAPATPPGGDTAPADGSDASSMGAPSPQPGLAAAGMTPTPVVNGTGFANNADAAAAAAAQNTPEARDARIAQTLRERGNPVGAMAYEQGARQGQLGSMQVADKVWTQKVRHAMENGHQGLADLVSQSQGGDLAQHKLKAVPSADGKTVTYSKVNDDGSVTPLPNLTFSNDQDGVIKAAYMLDRAVDPATRYKNMLEEDKQTAAISQKESDLKLRQRQLEEVQIPNAETRAQLADVKKQLAEMQASRGNGNVTHEERMRYTTLFTEAGRRLRDTQQTLNQLQRDPIFMRNAKKDGTPEAQQLKSLNDDMDAHRQERDMYRGMLVNSQTAAPTAPAPAPAASPTASPAPGGPSAMQISPADQAARDSDAAQILQTELASTQKRLAASKDPDEQQRLTGDVAALQREIARTKPRVSLAGATPRNGAPAAAPTSGSTTPVKVSTAAERNALKPGTRYTAPDGQVYIKQ